jgi:hypothetical protein
VNRIQKRIKSANDYKVNKVEETKEYDSKKYLNWRDDGDALSDPCMNDYLAGYQIEPYEFKQWAGKKNIPLQKTADLETVVMQFTPEFLADRIVTLWNGADGPLQSFFEGFTLRYDNKMKMQLAEILAGKGFEVYPVLTDDKPRYARKVEILKKIASSKSFDAIMLFGKIALAQSDGLRLLIGELEDLEESGVKVTAIDTAGLLDYYKQIYPQDFALQLVTDLIEKPEQAVESNFEHFKDYSISDESLDKIEDYMSGNAHPMYTRDGGNGGWDFTTDSRNTDGTAPSLYETRASKKKA